MPIKKKNGTIMGALAGAGLITVAVVMGTQVVDEGGADLTPPVEGCAQSTTHVPDGPDGMGGCWPGPANTGIPAGITLTAYTGPCTITADDTVIDSKLVDCDLTIEADNVTISRSQVDGTVFVADGSTGVFVTVTDSYIDSSPDGFEASTGVTSDNFLVRRSEVVGGNRSIYCRRNCTVEDSYVHGQLVENPWHASGIRMSQDGTLTHNTIWCEAQPILPEGGCSADQTGYPDFEPTKNWLIQRNLYMANETGNGFCAYGGVGDNKPFGMEPDNATNIRFIDNVFQRGSPGGTCGDFGPIVAFRTGNTGNIWTGNVWDTGETVPPTE